MECPHCGVEGQPVNSCEDYRAPHVCPNDHITHARPDLFCQLCGGILVREICPACSHLRDDAAYREYHVAVVDAMVSEVGEQARAFFDDCDFFEGFLTKTDPSEEALEQLSA